MTKERKKSSLWSVLGTVQLSKKNHDPLFFNFRAMKLNKMPPDMKIIFQEVCNYFNIDIDAAVKRTRKREIVQVRQISMFFSKKLTKHSLACIGSEHGGKGHATVLHAIKTINDLYDTDRRIRYDVQTLEKKFNKKFLIIIKS